MFVEYRSRSKIRGGENVSYVGSSVSNLAVEIGKLVPSMAIR